MKSSNLCKVDVFAIDAWGNQEDGWDVNEKYYLGHFSTSGIDSLTSVCAIKKYLIEKLKENLFIKSSIKENQLSIESSEDIYYIDSVEGEPILELRAG